MHKNVKKIYGVLFMKVKLSKMLIMSIIMATCIFSSPSPAGAYLNKPFLHPVFTDHMVLQRDAEDNVWGWTNPGEKVTVEIGEKVSSGTADLNGKWLAKIGPFPKGGPYQMKVTGSQSVTINDILFGEVWLCAGQSNMAMQLPNAANGAVEAQNANNPSIRFFTTPYQGSTSASEVFGYVSSWQPCNSQTVANLSAVGYFFARALNIEMDVPVGIICSAVGGSFMESWIGNDAFKAFMDSNPVPGYQPSSPNMYYNGMIAPLIPFMVKGIMWYQGESNTQYNYLYDAQLQTLINDWRSKFGLGRIPFIIIQLPNYQSIQLNPVEDASWVPIREAELNAVLRDNTNGLVVTIDIGEEDIHPINKQDVGKRAAICALGKYYGESIVPSGPIISSMTKEGNKIRVSFDYTGSGLATGTKTGLDPVQLSDSGPLKGFAIAGSDNKFVWADAVIENSNTVLVSSPSVSNPVAVRYSWANNPIGNLYNKEGLPASPFRTDSQFMPSSPPSPTPAPTSIPTSAPAGYKISGYVSPDFAFSSGVSASILSGFKVDISGTGLSAGTGFNGYFEINNVPASSLGYTVKISKANYLCREIKNVVVTGNKQLSSPASPILMWAGDIAKNGIQDDAINMSDVVEMAKSFNSSPGDGKYAQDHDFNKDNAINMSDIIIAGAHFNTVPSSYPAQ